MTRIRQGSCSALLSSGCGVGHTRMRRPPLVLHALLTIALALLSVQGVYGQNADAIQFDVFLGFNGVIVQNAWFPITVEIKNDGPAFSGQIEMSDQGSSGGQVRSLKVECPTGTLKRVMIPFYASPWGYSSIDAKLLDNRGRIILDRPGLVPQSQLRQSVKLIGAITRGGAGGPEIQKTADHEDRQRPGVVRLLPGLIPDNPLLLQGLSCVYLNSERAADLTPSQTAAIQNWMLAGGHLILGVEEIQHIEASAWLKEIVPWHFSGIKSTSNHRDLQDWITGPWPVPREFSGPRRRQIEQNGRQPEFPFADLGPDTKFENSPLRVAVPTQNSRDVLFKSDEVPLVLSRSEGLGKVTVLLFSPEREPFKSWKNAPVFWAKLAGVPGVDYVTPNSASEGGWNSDAVFGALLDSRQVRTLPLGMLFLLLLGYLIVIGPVDYLWLKKIKRPMLTWITFPTYVAAFSVLIYLIGYKLRSGELEWSELHMVDSIQANGVHAVIGRSYASLYSPSSRDYDFQGPPNRALFRTEAGRNWRSRGSSQTLEVRQKGESFDATGSVPVWTSLIFITDWLAAEPPPIVVSDIRPATGGTTFKVQNQFQRPLSLACMTGTRTFKLGEIRPGEELSFDTTTRAGVNLASLHEGLFHQMETAARSRNMAFGRSDTRFLNDWVGTVQALSAPARTTFASPPGLKVIDVETDQDKLVVFAWVEDFAPIEKLPRFDVKRISRKTMWRIILRTENTANVPNQ